MSANNDNLQSPTVLIVEDEILIRVCLADYLQDQGFKVLEAGSADDAVDIIENADTEIDVVFSDVMMPGKLNGFGLAQWVHAHHPELPIILTSGHSATVAESIRRCGTAALPKPYDFERVAGEIRKRV
jgi:DNA-binding NtrC family response regulator